MYFLFHWATLCSHLAPRLSRQSGSIATHSHPHSSRRHLIMQRHHGHLALQCFTGFTIFSYSHPRRSRCSTPASNFTL